MPKTYIRLSWKQVILVTFLGWTALLHGNPVLWTGAASSNYNDAGNWLGSGAKPPDINTQVTINVVNTLAQISGSGSAGGLIVGSSTVNNTLTLASAGASLFNVGDATLGEQTGSSGIVNISQGIWTNAGTGYLIVGKSGNGTLNITSSGGNTSSVSNTYGYIGLEQTSLNSTVTVSGTSSMWSNSQDLLVGVSGKGNLTISGGGTITNTNGWIGYYQNIVNTESVATVTDSGSKWENQGDLTVGNEGKGKLAINAGGLVNNSAAGSTAYIGREATGEGIVEVSGIGSKWTNKGSLIVGNAGVGNLTISTGGYVSNTNAVVGVNGTGVVEISGTSSKWINTGTLIIGDSSAGTMNMVGGRVDNTDGTISNKAGSVGIVTVGANSTWNNTGNLLVGNQSKGTLTIQDGGIVITGLTSAIGGSGDGSIAIVTGAGSKWTTGGNLSIGVSGTHSSLVIADGGNVVVNGGIVNIATFVGSSGTLQIGQGSGAGTLTTSVVTGGNGTSARVIFNHNETNYTFSPQITGTLQVQHNGTGTTILSGDNTFTGGTTVNKGMLLVNTVGGISATGTGGVNVSSGAVFGGKGTVTGNTTILGNLAPGLFGVDAAGQLNFSGDLSLSNTSKVIMEIVNVAQYDKIDVGGNLMLDGTLEVKLTGGTLGYGDSFDLLDWDPMIGLNTQFDNLILPDLSVYSGGLLWDTSKLYDNGTITVVPEPSMGGLFFLSFIALGVLIVRQSRKRITNFAR